MIKTMLVDFPCFEKIFEYLNIDSLLAMGRVSKSIHEEMLNFITRRQPVYNNTKHVELTSRVRQRLFDLGFQLLVRELTVREYVIITNDDYRTSWMSNFYHQQILIRIDLTFTVRNVNMILRILKNYREDDEYSGDGEYERVDVFYGIDGFELKHWCFEWRNSGFNHESDAESEMSDVDQCDIIGSPNNLAKNAYASKLTDAFSKSVTRFLGLSDISESRFDDLFRTIWDDRAYCRVKARLRANGFDQYVPDSATFVRLPYLELDRMRRLARPLQWDLLIAPHGFLPDTQTSWDASN
jgi:hypothetical protein